MLTAVCIAWVDRRPDVDPMTGAVARDERTSGLSLPDAAAIEWALRSRQQWGGSVLAVTVGPAAADAVLRDALAVGVDHCMRVDAPIDLDAESVAGRLADVLAGADLVWCGDLGADGGSGAVPAFLAARLGIAAALGLVEISFEDRSDRSILALRRLDGGRRERLRVTDRALLAVEGATARLRRGDLAASLAAPRTVIEVVSRPPGGQGGQGVRGGHGSSADRITRLASGPYRPRPRLLAAPSSASALERVRQLTGASGARDDAAAPGGAARSAPIVATPAAAADEILAALAAWGYELP